VAWKALRPDVLLLEIADTFVSSTSWFSRREVTYSASLAGTGVVASTALGTGTGASRSTTTAHDGRLVD
jgi:hypothetical protein